MSTPPPAQDAPKSDRPSSSRLPSLNQLAARINAGSGASATPNSTSTGRPRLAAALLRTGSTTSLSTQASAADSTAVNLPSTRAVSPAAGTPPPRSADTPVSSIPGGEALTSENLEELDHQTQEPGGAPAPATVVEKKIRGYKNIPSLDAITARLAKARILSIDGTANPPEAETIEDPQTPGVRMKAPEHPLENTLAPYTPNPPPVAAPAPVPVEPPSSAGPAPAETHEYEAGLTVIGEFNTVETFCRYFNWLKPPSKLERNSNYHLFKSGIKPMWEDEANANGGKWVLTMKNNPQLLDRSWSWLAMALVGEELDDGDELCGVVVSLRAKVDRIQLWTRSKEDVEKLNGIAKKLVKLLDISEADGIGLEFQFNSDDRPPHNKFLSISSLPLTSFRTTFRQGAGGPGDGPPHASAPPERASGAFNGAFGAGGGGGVLGGGWRPGKKG